MRARLLTVALTAALAGCASMHKVPAPAPAPVEATSEAQSNVEAAPEVRPAAHLACLQHPDIDAWETRLRANRGYWAPSVNARDRGGRHLPRLRHLVTKAGLPESLALLPVIESGFRAHARSRDGGGGLWQLQRPTARRFGLAVGGRRDERFDPDRSTLAATRYLRFLHARYRDWPLALAAYNAGEGRVDRALARRPGSTVWELARHRHIPPRTADYVGRFLAVVRLVEPPDVGC